MSKPKRCMYWIKEAGMCVAKGSGYEHIVGCKGYDRGCVMYEEVTEGEG